MMETSITVRLEPGLQARPAAKFVQEANRYAAHLVLEKNGKRVNAKSIMGLMSLAIATGETVKLIAEGSDEEVALNHLVSLVTEASE